MSYHQGYNTGYPYKGMELLQPEETTSTSSKRQSLEGRKSHQREKTRAAKTTGIQSKDGTTLEEVDVFTTKEETDDDRKSATVIGRQEPAAVTVSPPSSAVDDTWDFLSDSPQKVVTETGNHPVRDSMKLLEYKYSV